MTFPSLQPGRPGGTAQRRPNREAVKILGCNQPRAEGRFTELLTSAADEDNPPESALGMHVSGGFGTGKSHLLAHLEEQACPRVCVQQGGRQQGDPPL